MSRWNTGTFIKAAAVVLCLMGFRFHDLTVQQLKPNLPILAGSREGTRCGTGSTATWTAWSTSCEVALPVEKVRAEVERALRGDNFMKVPGVLSGETVFGRELPEGGSVSVRVRPHYNSSQTSVFQAIGFPKVSWWGLRIPSF